MKMFLILATLSLAVMAEEDEDRDLDYANMPKHYGRPTLYYSEEGYRQRRELEMLRESNNLQKQMLELERERLRNEYSEGRHKR